MSAAITVRMLEEIVQKVCPKTGKRRRPDPKSLEPLAAELNGIDRRFQDQYETANAEKKWKSQEAAAYAAVATLRHYFEARLLFAQARGDPCVIEKEKRLGRSAIKGLVDAMYNQAFELEFQDYWFHLAFSKKAWHDIAEEVAAAFKTAMRSTNGNAVLGNSQGGPVARFVAAVIPFITGEDDPGPKAVGEHP